MKWQETKVIFESDQPETAQDLVSYLLMELGADGVEVTEPGKTGMVADGSGSDEPDSAQHSVTAYWPLDASCAGKQDRLRRELDAMEKNGLGRFAVAYGEEEDQPWETAWKAHFHPVEVTGRLVVKPSWEPYGAKPGQIVIELDPGMAFGTGTHPTTALCMEMIEGECLRRRPRAFLDVGTGSGILMIAAFKLGARRVFGCDNDLVALAACRENLAHNQVPLAHSGLWLGDLASGAAGGAFDFAAANITAEANAALIPGLPRILAPGALFVASGIMREKKDMVIHALESCRFSLQEVKEKGGWAGISARLA